MEAPIVLLTLLLVVLVWNLYKCQKRKDSFLPSKSWDDWDNYDKDYGNTRAYWGSVDSEGGWSGNPHSPSNDPSGYGFGAASPDYNRRINRNKNIFHRHHKEINLATASDDELTSKYRMGIMSNK